MLSSEEEVPLLTQLGGLGNPMCIMYFHPYPKEATIMFIAQTLTNDNIGRRDDRCPCLRPSMITNLPIK